MTAVDWVLVVTAVDWVLVVTAVLFVAYQLTRRMGRS